MRQRAIYHVRVYQITQNVNMLDHYLAGDKGFYRDQELEVTTVIGTESRAANPAEMLASGGPPHSSSAR